ncbi:Sodium/calcium exchanger membrane region [Penicillium nucicola]|uniref:Sodium/calcium exchanger membrane region n=1 Tax=Penicillium nucicola TaxID=1850975 RepID=UPI00254589AF|nr:Sodium/calcium exchanger membrane region [Penicillium nucicola]KAJ5774994.1 Sodium/calcium exchanger membrane region [Penicillium nucicola]
MWQGEMQTCDDNLSVPRDNIQSCTLTSVFKTQAKEMMNAKVTFSAFFSIAAIIVSNIKVPPLLIFVWNLLAIIPLSITLTEATELISRDLGETAGALLNISVGNLAELIVFLTALLKNEIKVVQLSLLGSILVNLLLVLGSAIIAGSITSQNLTYNTEPTHSFVGLLNLTTCCLVIPSAFYGIVKNTESADHMSLEFSRAVSFILLGIYFLYLFFQFNFHPGLFTRRAISSAAEPLGSTCRSLTDIESQPTSVGAREEESSPQMQQAERSTSPIFSSIQIESTLPLIQMEAERAGVCPLQGSNNLDKNHTGCRCDYNIVLANRTLACTLLVTSTILIAICAEYFALTLELLNEQGILSESFVGLIIIPIAGNVAENVTAVVVAAKDQMDLAISVALGSAIQIGLLVSPLVILMGWALGKSMTLSFDGFELVTLVGAVLLVSFIVLKGKTNYLEGSILCACFAAVSYVGPILDSVVNFSHLTSVGAFLLPE